MPLKEKVANYGPIWKKMEESCPDLRQRWELNAIPESESIADLIRRVKRGLVTIAKNHPDEKVAIFCHKKVIQAVLADIYEKELHSFLIGNCDLVEVTFDHESATFSASAQGLCAH